MNIYSFTCGLLHLTVQPAFLTREDFAPTYVTKVNYFWYIRTERGKRGKAFKAMGLQLI